MAWSASSRRPRDEASAAAGRRAARDGGPRRPLLVPEVLQASALDCGPAALAALLAGFGLARPFDELRDACRTGHDGTSIDTLEAVAIEQGLDAEQALVPPDHLALPEAACLPCVLVVMRPGGATHFVTLWRLHGRRAQLMDPAGGRRWPTLAALDGELYRHRAIVPATAWREWAASDRALQPLAARLAALGVAAAERRALLSAATAVAGWRPLAALDAATRFAQRLVSAGGVRRGRAAARLLGALLERALAAAVAGSPPVLPASSWTVRPAAPGPGGDERLRLEGAVLVRIRGYRPAGGPARQSRTSLVAATFERLRGRRLDRAMHDRRPDGRQGRRALGERLPERCRETGRRRDQDHPAGNGEGWSPAPPGAAGLRATLALATGGAALGRFAEAALFAGALELLPAVPFRGVRLAADAGLLSLAAALWLLELAATGATQALGRRCETGLRLALAAKLPRLPDRYLRTRLLADLSERAHLIAHLGRGPALAAMALRAALDVLLACAGIAWLDPPLASGALAAGLAALVLPLLLVRRCEERSRRVRAHVAALGGHYLDVLRGVAAIRAHGAAGAMRRRHDELLAGWLRARRGADAAGAWLDVASQALLSSTAAGLVLAHLLRHGLGLRALVLVLWAFQLLAAGKSLAVLAGRELPLQRSLLRRIEEPLAAAEADGADDADCTGDAPWATAARRSPMPAPGPRPPQSSRPPQEQRHASTASPGDRGIDLAWAAVAPAPAGRGIALAWERCRVEIDGRPLLHELDLAIPAGQHVALLGPSGAGKSTLLGTLLGWHRPAAGRLLAGGLPLDAARLAELRRATAWAAPEVSLWRASLLENLTAGAAAPATEALASGAPCAAVPVTAALPPAEALRAALLLELVPQLPLGLQTPLGEGGGCLSGGEAQRLRFARALLRPGVRLALLDEPFRGLAADQRHRLLAAARARWRQTTLLCVTHAPAEAAGFDRLLVLEQGRVVEDGPPAHLAARAGSRYRAMLDADARAAAALLAPGWRSLRLARGSLREMGPAAAGAAAPPRAAAAAASVATTADPRAARAAATPNVPAGAEREAGR